MNTANLIGLALIAFAVYTFLKSKGIDTPEEVGDSLQEVGSSLKDSIKDIFKDIQEGELIPSAKPNKIELLKRFIQALDPVKDKKKIEEIVDLFGLEFLKDHLYDKE